MAEAALAPLARQLAATLLYLHSIGMLHCDLRPGNVLLDGACPGGVCSEGVCLRGVLP